MKKYQGASRLLLRPTTTEQVSRIMAHCHARSLAVVPQVGCEKCGHVGRYMWDYALHQMSIDCKYSAHIKSAHIKSVNTLHKSVNTVHQKCV